MFGIILYVFAALGLFACVVPFVQQHRLRVGVVSTYLGLSLFVLATTEGLSILRGIDRPAILMAWGLLVVGCGVFFCRGAGRACLTSWKRDLREGLIRRIGREIWCHKMLAMGLFGILFFTFLGALFYAPNTFDAMTYHMTRVMHWLQNRDVSYVLTNDQRLNFQLPLAEFWILHFQLLLKQDYLANVVQWNAFFVSIVTVTLLAAELGMSRNVQWISALVMGTIPNVLFQAQSTQNDLVVGSYVLIFAWMMQKLVRSITVRRMLVAGCAMGLGLYAKGTGFLYIAIVGFFYGLWILIRNRKKWLRSGLKCMVIVVVGLAMLMPVFVRNIRQYGSPMPANPHAGSTYLVEDTKGIELLRVCVRSLILHIGLPSESWNRGVEAFCGAILGNSFFETKNTNRKTPIQCRFLVHEDTLGNFAHFVLFQLFVVILGVSVWRRRRMRRNGEMDEVERRRMKIDRNGLIFALISWGTMGMLFSSLCYSFFRARYHVPLFCLFSVSIAYGIERFVPNRVVRGCVIGFLFGCTAWFLPHNPNHPRLYNVSRNLRSDVFTENHQDYYCKISFYQSLTELKQYCTEHGIDRILYHNPKNQRDYPIYRVLGGAIQDQIQVQRVDYNPREDYGCSLLLIANNDAPYPEFREDFIPMISGRILFSNRDFGLFDMRQEKIDVEIPSRQFAPFVLGSFEREFVVDPSNSQYAWSTEFSFSVQNPSDSDVEVVIMWKDRKQPIGAYRYSIYGDWMAENVIPVKSKNRCEVIFRIPREVIQKGKPIPIRWEFSTEQENTHTTPGRMCIEEVRYSFCEEGARDATQGI